MGADTLSPIKIAHNAAVPLLLPFDDTARARRLLEGMGRQVPEASLAEVSYRNVNEERLRKKGLRVIP
jgi:hypothetical protein